MTALKSLRVCASLLAALCAGAPAAAQSFDQAIVLYFGAGDTRLGPDDVAVTGAVANYVRNCAGPPLVLVTGHDDAAGSESDALITSERRARAVAAAIDGAGVPSEAIRLDWKGETDLAQPTANGVAEALNRRVMIEVDCGGGGQRERVGQAWSAAVSVGAAPVDARAPTAAGVGRRGPPPQVPVTIVQRLGEGGCAIQARGVTSWQLEDNPSDTMIQTEVEVWHECPTAQLVRTLMDPCFADDSRASIVAFCEPVLLGFAHGPHVWPLHVRPSSVPWTPDSSQAPAVPNGSIMRTRILQNAIGWRPIRVQVASCEAFTSGGAQRALLLESPYNMGTGFMGVACETIPPPRP